LSRLILRDVIAGTIGSSIDLFGYLCSFLFLFEDHLALSAPVDRRGTATPVVSRVRTETTEGRRGRRQRQKANREPQPIRPPSPRTTT
jgi:hypothetical protein